jgi:beta-fructofuranosidase
MTALAADWYAPPGQYAWDFWLVRHADRWHLFHLQAPRRLAPDARHQHSSIGHAVSEDLRRWQYRGTALAAGTRGAWDDRCLWTGSILPWQGRFWMLYTGRRRDEFLVQRIGLAVSDDLEHWEKHPANPLLCADPRWYQTAPGGGMLAVEDWRDPYLCVVDGQLTALITARLPLPAGTSKHRFAAAFAGEALRSFTPLPLPQPTGPLAGRGCIARATSADMVAWTVHPPLLAPGHFDQMECPQWIEHAGMHYLTFSALRGWYERSWAVQAGGAETGLHVWCAPSFTGPWAPVNRTGVVLGTSTDTYATRLVPAGDGGWQGLSWRMRVPGQRRFCGRIDTPRAVSIEGTTVTVDDSQGRKE